MAKKDAIRTDIWKIYELIENLFSISSERFKEYQFYSLYYANRASDALNQEHAHTIQI